MSEEENVGVEQNLEPSKTEPAENKVVCPRPVSIRKVKDKFGFHRVYVYDGLEMLTYIISERVKQQVKKQDTVFMVSGLEGVGKSGFTLWAAEVYNDVTGRTVPVQNITRRVKELFGRIYTLRDEPSFITLDEGAELDGTNASTKEVKKTKEKFTVMRKCSHIVMICFVNPLRITTYFREDRVRGLFFVVKHGEVWYYSNNQNAPHLASIIDSWKKEHDAKSLKFLKKYAPDMILKGIPNYNGYLKQEYEARKDGNIGQILGEDAPEQDTEVDTGVPIGKREWLNVQEASKYTGLGDGTLRLYKAQGKFNCIKIRNRVHFNRQELDRFLHQDTKVNI